jgi:endonuclease I
MLRLAVVLFLLGNGYAEASGYYSSAVGKSRSALRQVLHVIISSHTIIPYDSSGRTDTVDALMILDEDAANTNNVFLVYAQRSEPKTNYGNGGWNREHLWPQSYGLTNELAKSDLHNLRAEDGNVNSARGNKLFDVSNTNHVTYRFPAHAEALLCSTDSDSWEPPAHVKGDIARSLFYLAVRYQGGTTNEPNLILTDVLSEVRGTTNLMGRLTTLLQWHLGDPVDYAEGRRNDLIYERYQHNRNPFVDNPEWVLDVFAPELSIRREGHGCRLSWPAIYKDAVVLNSSSLAQPGAAWFDWGGSVTQTNGELFMIRPEESTSGYFRLGLR